MMISELSEGHAMMAGEFEYVIREAMATPDEMCGCEHEDHFKNMGLHEYAKAPAGSKRGLYVGLICDACAKHCMADFLI